MGSDEMKQYNTIRLFTYKKLFDFPLYLFSNEVNVWVKVFSNVCISIIEKLAKIQKML